MSSSQSKLAQPDRLLSDWHAGMVFLVATFISSVWARWLGSEVLDFAPVWPAAGIALAASVYRPLLLIAVAFGLFSWSILAQGHTLAFSFANLLTLTGAVLFGAYYRRRRAANPDGVLSIFSNYRSLLLLAVLPASIIGTLIYADSYSFESILDILLIYIISETAGIALFAPVMALTLARANVLTNVLSRYNQVNLLVVVFIAFLPLICHWFDRSEYAEAAFLLIFPSICWIAIQNDRALMAITIVIFAIAQLMLEVFDVGLDVGPTVFEFVERVIWLLAAYVTGDILLAYSLARKNALDKALWQATHHEGTGWLNQRGLTEELNTFPAGTMDIVIAQVCRRDLLIASLRYTELKDIERALASSIGSLHDWPLKARLSDLTYCFIVPSTQRLPLDGDVYQSINIDAMDISVKLGWSRVPLESFEMDTCLVELYTGLQLALDLPANRYLERTRTDLSFVATESNFVQYQRVVAALEGGQLQLWGQPICALNGGKPSVELLSRIENPDGSLMSPAVFLDALSAFDELEILDRAVILAAIAEGGPIQSLLPHFNRININLSGSTLCDTRFASWLDKIWPSYIPRENVCFELTESELIRNLEVAKGVYGTLRRSGFQTAIDDFGSGLASYEYLEHFPADLIKVDGFVIKDILDNQIHLAMVKGTATIAGSLGNQLCAEFVGCEKTAKLLKEEGVDYLQGFYIAKPVPVTDLYAGWSPKLI